MGQMGLKASMRTGEPQGGWQEDLRVVEVVGGYELLYFYFYYISITTDTLTPSALMNAARAACSSFTYTYTGSYVCYANAIK